MISVTGGVPNPYALGHGNQELERLIRQGRYLGDLSARFLALAGLEPGMHVLDVGCGAGDLSFIAAQMVGSTGSVTGLDRSADAVALGMQRAAAAGLTNVRLLVEDAVAYTSDTRFDAMIGRLVLMYFPDPSAALRRLATHVRRDGIITFHELDLESPKTEPRCPSFVQTMQWMRETLVRVDADIRMGARLGAVFEKAGLPSPEMLLAARVERGPHAAVYDLIAGITRTLLPSMERTGVATAAEVNIDTLADRLRQEALALDATTFSPSLIAAWSRQPS